jgi:hypothetical protein
VVLVVIAAAGGLLWWRGGDKSAATPPVRAEPTERALPRARAAPPGALPEGAEARERLRTRPRAPEPEAPKSHEIGIRVYAEAVKAGEKNPGEKAFRADSKAFFEHNAQLAEERAEKEGITLDELDELTYLGLLAMHLRRWDDAAQVAEHEISPEDRQRADELIFSSSNEMKAAIREHVKKGDSPEVRWATIRKLQTSFIEKYQAITKMSPQNFDLFLSLPFTDER